MTLPLSILDLAPVPDGTPSQMALQHIVDLARLGDELGYTRLWYAEHHGMPSIASSSPEVLIATAAAATRRIHVGSGGVMLPNHVPLRVVETYRTLNGLHPGRIDLGIGRAGGSDARTLSALRSVDGSYFPQEMAEMLAFEQAETCTDPTERRALLNFVVVGGGPTGVEMAGAIAELARHSLVDDFRAINPAEARVILVEAGPRLLPAFPESLSAESKRALEKLGVEVMLGRPVTDCTAEICAPISSVALAVWLASVFTSEATTAKPRPASPARAASIVALSASRLVCSAMSLISRTTVPIFSVAALRLSTSVLVAFACSVASLAILVLLSSWRPISWTEAASSSLAPATAWTLTVAAFEALATVWARSAAPLAVPVIDSAVARIFDTASETSPRIPEIAVSNRPVISVTRSARAARAACSSFCWASMARA